MPPAPDPALLDTTFGGGFTVARVAAPELTHLNAPGLGEALSALAGTAPRVVVDLGAVTFLGSGGLFALLSAHKAVAAAGGVMTVVNVGPFPAEVLARAGLDAVLDLRPAGVPARPGSGTAGWVVTPAAAGPCPTPPPRP